METKSVDVYHFTELSAESKANAIDIYRNECHEAIWERLTWSLENDEWLKLELEAIGLTYDRLYWSTCPYWASFHKLTIEDLPVFLKACGASQNYISWITDKYISLDFVTHICDEMIYEVRLDSYSEDVPYCYKQENERILANALSLIQEWETKATQQVRDEEEYYFLDEAIIETFEDREIEFRVDGTLYIG